MGLRGPVPKPTALRIASGRQAYNYGEPQPDKTPPPCPDYLDDVARSEWDRQVEILMDMGVLTEADGPALATLCVATSILARAQKELETSDLTVSEGSRVNPIITVINTQIDTITKISREFGLTPAARTRIRADDQVMLGDPIERILAGD